MNRNKKRDTLPQFKLRPLDLTERNKYDFSKSGKLLTEFYSKALGIKSMSFIKKNERRHKRMLPLLDLDTSSSNNLNRESLNYFLSNQYLETLLIEREGFDDSSSSSNHSIGDEINRTNSNSSDKSCSSSSDNFKSHHGSRIISSSNRNSIDNKKKKDSNSLTKKDEKKRTGETKIKKEDARLWSRLLHPRVNINNSKLNKSTHSKSFHTKSYNRQSHKSRKRKEVEQEYSKDRKDKWKIGYESKRGLSLPPIDEYKLKQKWGYQYLNRRNNNYNSLSFKEGDNHLNRLDTKGRRKDNKKNTDSIQRGWKMDASFFQKIKKKKKKVRGISNSMTSYQLAQKQSKIMKEFKQKIYGKYHILNSVG